MPYYDEFQNAIWDYVQREPDNATPAHHRCIASFGSSWTPPLPSKAELLPSELAPKFVTIVNLTDAHGLESIRDVFSARRLKLKRDGDVVDLGPNYDIHFAAIRLIMNFSSRGPQADRGPKEGHAATYL